MKPIENRWFRHARSGQDRPKAGTTIGERGQVTVVGSAHGLEVSANQRRDVGVALRNSAKYLPTSARRLDVADANLQMAFAVVALRMKVESKLMLIAGSAVAGLARAASRSCSPIFSV